MPYAKIHTSRNRPVWIFRVKRRKLFGLQRKEPERNWVHVHACQIKEIAIFEMTRQRENKTQMMIDFGKDH